MNRSSKFNAAARLTAFAAALSLLGAAAAAQEGEPNACYKKAEGLSVRGYVLRGDQAFSLCRFAADETPVACYKQAMGLSFGLFQMNADQGVYLCADTATLEPAECYAFVMGLNYPGEILTPDGGVQVCRHARSKAPALCYQGAMSLRAFDASLKAHLAARLCAQATDAVAPIACYLKELEQLRRRGGSPNVETAVDQCAGR